MRRVAAVDTRRGGRGTLSQNLKILTVTAIDSTTIIHTALRLAGPSRTRTVRSESPDSGDTIKLRVTGPSQALTVNGPPEAQAVTL